MPEIVRYPTTIIHVEERFEKRHLSGFGDNTTFRNESLGWFVVTDLGIVLPCGQGKPDFQRGDHCRLTLERLECQPPPLPPSTTPSAPPTSPATPSGTPQSVSQVLGAATNSGAK